MDRGKHWELKTWLQNNWYSRIAGHWRKWVLNLQARPQACVYLASHSRFADVEKDLEFGAQQNFWIQHHKFFFATFTWCHRSRNRIWSTTSQDFQTFWGIMSSRTISPLPPSNSEVTLDDRGLARTARVASQNFVWLSFVVRRRTGDPAPSSPDSFQFSRCQEWESTYDPEGATV